ncbi:Ras GTPase-activating-like protein [Dirofilaria immitis]
MDEIIDNSMIATTTTTTATTAVITKRKIIQLNDENNSDNDMLSVTRPSTIYTESMDEIIRNKDICEITSSNHSIELSENSQLSDNNTDVQFHQFTDKISSSHVEPMDIRSSHTIDKLDEKRENEKVYEYLLRLTEVRNWLKEYLHLDDIVKETELEQNLSNGVLLARLAHSFAPSIVPLSKIFDINQNRFYSEGQACYRHTDNISLWKDAIRSINFPEILIPDTVDIYEGRNIKTIFSLYALAKYLHQIRRGPSIRREDNVQYSSTILNDTRERLKDSDLSLFGNIDEILSTIPGNLDAHMQAVIQLNNSIDNKDALLKCLKYPDTGILYVSDAFIDQYQEGLYDRRKSLRMNEFLNREQIQSVITEINHSEALERLEYLLKTKKISEMTEISQILDDLKQDDILRNADLLYAKELYKIRHTQNLPLNVKQIETVLKVVNTCIRIRFYVFENDECKTYEGLKYVVFGMRMIVVKRELIEAYMKAIREKYDEIGTDNVLIVDELCDIVEGVNYKVINQEQLKKITKACDENDCDNLLLIIRDLSDIKVEYILYYMNAMKKYQPLTMDEVNEVIQKVNQNVAIATIKSRDTLHLNLLLMDDKKDKAAELLLKSWEIIIRNILLSQYVIRLTDEIIIRKRRKWEMNKDEKNDGEYLREQFEDGILYINVDNEQVIYHEPNRIIEWMLTRDEIKNISEVINDDYDEMMRKNENDKKIKEKAAIKIQQWWKKRLLSKNFEELKISEKPSLRVVRHFVALLLRTKNDEKEDRELEENRLYAIKLINDNRYLEEKMMDLDDKIAKKSISKIQLTKLLEFLKNIRIEADKRITHDTLSLIDNENRMTWNSYEIILFYLQTKLEYFVRLMGKYGSQLNVLSDLFRISILPIYNYGINKREMSLLGLLLAKYLREEIKQLNDPIDFRNNSSYAILQILIESYGKMESQRLQIAGLNQKLNHTEYRGKYFNLNPISLFESITGTKPKNIDEAMRNATVVQIFNDSKQFLVQWATAYAEIIFGKITEYPDIIRYMAVSARNELRKRFPMRSDTIILESISAWLYNGCWMKVITATENLNLTAEKTNEYSALAIRKAISKFIEYSVLHFGYGNEKYWLNSLNDTITKISVISKWHFKKFVMQNPPIYNYSIQDEEWDKYGSYRPVLHIRICQLRVTLQRIQNNVNEIIPKNLWLNRFIIDTSLPDDNNMEQYVTLHLHPFIPDENDFYNELFRRTMRYVEQCLLSGCSGNNLTQLLARHTFQKEEEIFQKLSHQNDDQPTLDDTKCNIVRQLSTLEKAKRVTSINNYQHIVTAIAKDINNEENYRKNREAQLVNIRKLVIELEKTRLDYRRRLERYEDYLKRINN